MYSQYKILLIICIRLLILCIIVQYKLHACIWITFIAYCFILYYIIMCNIIVAELVGCATPESCKEICDNKAGCTNIAYPLLVVKLLPAGARGVYSLI